MILAIDWQEFKQKPTWGGKKELKPASTNPNLLQNKTFALPKRRK